jgi:hypothetical protein
LRNGAIDECQVTHDDPRVASGRCAAIRLLHQTNPGIHANMIPDQRSRLVGGAIIDDNDVQGSVGLFGDGSQGFLKGSGRVDAGITTDTMGS